MILCSINYIKYTKQLYNETLNFFHQDLFLKAYLTAKKDDLIDDDRSEQDVLLALKYKSTYLKKLQIEGKI